MGDNDYVEHDDALAEWLSWPVELELRQRGRHLVGSFPYGSLATMASRGRVRKERFSPRAFAFAINDESREINLLADHRFGRPLASRQGGTLQIEDTPKGVFFDATLPPESKQPSWMVDAVLSVRAGLTRGISPGFNVPPRSVVPNAEELIPEPGNAAVQIRQINQAVLFELSLVTRPQYLGTEIDIRAEHLSPNQLEEVEAKAKAALIRRAYRWL